MPSLAGPGYLSSLLLGFLLPTPIAITVAVAESGRTERSPEAAYLRGTGAAALAGAATALALLLQGARVGLCEPAHDWQLFALGPFAGFILAGAYGASAGIIAGAVALRRFQRVAVILAVIGPLGVIALGIWRFYSSPMVFAFDPFVGFFAGTPYDTGFDPIPRLVSYRLGTLSWVLGGWASWRLLNRSFRGRLTLRKPFDAPLAGAASLFLVFAGVIAGTGKTLGHYSTAESIRDHLGHTLEQGRCEIVFSGGISRPAAERLGRDCAAWLDHLENTLGVPKLPKVTAFVFADPGEKEAAMGAGHTQVAKPWRREIYLNGAEYPHPTLGHELAHVVAGEAGRGPFKIAGKLGGWLPNVGLIEGAAVALAPDEDDDLSAEQWAKALDELHQLPPLRSLFGLDFLIQPGRLAYTVAGAFVGWVQKTWGSSAVRRWYGGESLETITGQSLQTLEQRWKRELGQLTLPDSAREAARRLFSRKSALVRHCPHAVDRALGTALDALNGQDPARACQLTDAALKLDAEDLRLRGLAAECRHRGKDEAGAESRWAALMNDEKLAVPERDQAREALADRALERGELPRAREAYLQITDRTLDVDRRRTLEVKASVSTPEAIAAIEALLTGGTEGANWDRGAARIAEWTAAEPGDGLPRYLLGRNLINRGQFGEAERLLDEAMKRKLAPPSVKSEAQRLQLILACASQNREKVRRWLPAVMADEQLPLPRRQGAAALAARCTGEKLDVATAIEPSVPSKPNQKDTSATPSEVPRDAGADSSSVPKLDAGPAQGQKDAGLAASEMQKGGSSCPDGMELIPGGESWIGANPRIYSPEEGPRFKTRLASFCLDRTEVTLSAWLACVQAGKCTDAGKGAATCNARHPDRQEHPVNCVDYKQSEAYCEWKGARLPTEFEWEYAAHGGDQQLKYPWGDASPDGRTCWKQPGTCPVKSYAAGVFGLYDMSGNVWEWTSSDFGPYPFPPVPGSSSLKVYRGGSWSRRFEKWMHLGLRNRFHETDSGSHLGLRCAKSLANECPFERDAAGNCLHGVLDVECERGQSFNGWRCAKPDQPQCPEGLHAQPGYGCVRDIPLEIKHQSLDLAQVSKARSPEFDKDCRQNQPTRPNAYRLRGGEHLARNAVGSRAHCKNRDVGVGWNSVCCP